MSPSDPRPAGEPPACGLTAGELVARCDELITAGHAGGADPAALRDLVTAAARLYAAAAEGAPDAGAEPDPLHPSASTTDAVVLACALLRSRGLNPFDLALWFNRGRAAG